MKIINKLISLVLVILFLGFTTANGQATEVRTFSGIDGVALLGSGDVSISLGNKEEITIHAPADLIPYLLTENKDGTLQIGKRKKGWKKFIRFNDHVHYDLIVKQISDIRVSGSGDIDVEKLAGENCTVEVSGSGNIEVDRINSNSANVTVSGSGDVDIDNLSSDILGVSINGSGDINLAGKADELDVTINGSGDFTGNELKSENVSVNIYGSGNSNVYVTKSLKVHVSGSGDVIYHGNPTVNSRVTGSGDIRHH